MKKYVALIFMTVPFFTLSQDKIEGVIMERNSAGKASGLPGANVYWLNSQMGAITNDKGLFTIPYAKEYNKLIISYVGFKTDTLIINEPKMVRHTLQPSNELDEVVVQQERDAVEKTFFSAMP